MFSTFSVDALVQYRRDISERRSWKEDVPIEGKSQQDLVEAYLPFVIRIARAYEYTGVELLDLIQEGNLGLIVAAKKFDPSRETKFSTYAVYWIKQAITTALSAQSTSLSSSRYKYQRLQFLRKAREAIQEQDEGTLTQQLAEYMGTSTGSVLALINLQQGMNTASLDVQTGEHEEDTLANLLEADPQHSPEYIAFLQSRNEQIQRLLKLLTKAERQVIILRYGLRDGEEHTYGEIVQRTHLGLEKIHSLEQRALMKMRRLAMLKQLQDFI